jgi:hypothetical protein
MKMRPVAVELRHTDGQTDRTKLIVAFRNFANEPKKHPKLTLYRVVGNVLLLNYIVCSLVSR